MKNIFLVFGYGIPKDILKDEFISLNCISKGRVKGMLSLKAPISFKSNDGKEHKGLVYSYEETGVYAGTYTFNLTLVKEKGWLKVMYKRFMVFVKNLKSIKDKEGK